MVSIIYFDEFFEDTDSRDQYRTIVNIYLLLLVTVPQVSTKQYILLRQTPLNNCFRNFFFVKDFGEKKTYLHPH